MKAIMKPVMSPQNDPWDPIHSLAKHGKHVLTSVEMTVTNLCNMRCEHCAVGDALVMKEEEKLPLPLILKRLEEVEHLQTISITGGEPTFHERSVNEYVLPLLKYAKDRGVYTQINSNVTLDLSRYERLAPYLDVLHISFNYTDADDFHQIGFAHTGREVKKTAAAKLYEQMINNTIALSKGGVFVSAESMINYRTHKKLPQIHRMIVEMGCKRHEVHPMYPSSFAANLPSLSLHETRTAIHDLLDHRDPDVWMLFGTLPFYSCGPNDEDQQLIRRLREAPAVTVRNDPDGRNRLNVNLFTGEVFVTDFSSLASLGTIQQDRLDDVFTRWLGHPLNLMVNCHCPEAQCCGPNLLVADAYYKGVNFKQRKAIL